MIFPPVGVVKGQGVRFGIAAGCDEMPARRSAEADVPSAAKRSQCADGD